jgi:hypothetical protein
MRVLLKLLAMSQIRFKPQNWKINAAGTRQAISFENLDDHIICEII